MAACVRQTPYTVCKLLKPILTTPITPNGCIILKRGSKHWNPKWKWHRSQKVMKIDLPDYHGKDNPDNMTNDQLRSKMKERGIPAPRYWKERPFFISSTGGIFEPFVPPEGDGKVSMISKTGAKQRYDILEKKGKSLLAIRKIKSFDEDFDTDEFPVRAQEVYISAHNALLSKDPEKLSEFVTERGIPEMLNNIMNKTLHWKFLQSIEPPRIVHARYTDVITKTNLFAQVTVRFHTQQMLAIYDRFGRLMHGSEILAKDVLEYIVFEKHLTNFYGKWRLHDKVIPDWMPVPDAPPRTYRAEQLPAAPETDDTATTQVVPSISPTSTTSTSTPTIAAA